MSTEFKEVKDIKGRNYQLDQKIGEGGQGSVYTVKGGKLAIKCLIESSSDRKNFVKEQIKRIKHLDLTNINVTKPLEILEDKTFGYVMERLTGMQPLKDLFTPPKEINSIGEWYQQTGGLQRRLRLLAKIAETLSMIHGRGLVYADPSPNNIFVSEDVLEEEIRLIDSDNLHYKSSIAMPSIYTRDYAAPELLLEQSGVNSLTDTYAFAVLAFQTLTLIHPLLDGDLVQNGEPDLEDQVLLGELPWVECESDSQNRSSVGIPRNLVLSKRLKELFIQTFEQGLLNRLERPSMAEWKEYLYRAADGVLACSECGASYFYNNECCPWCEHPRSSFVLAKIVIRDPELEILKQELKQDQFETNLVESLFVITEVPFFLTQRHIDGSNNEQRIEFTLTENRLNFCSLNEKTYQLKSEKQSSTIKDEKERVPLNENWYLYLGDESKLHRFIVFELKK